MTIRCVLTARWFRLKHHALLVQSDQPPCIMCVQYIGGCSVHRGMFSTSGGVQYIGECSVHQGISWIHRGMFSTLGGYHDGCGGIPLSTSWGHRGMFSTSEGIMIHVEEQLNKIISVSIENSDVLSIPRCTHDMPPMYSWYPPDVLNIPWCTHGIPPHVSWYPPDVLNIPWCTHDIPPMYPWYPPMYWTSPDVLMVSLTCIMISPDVLMVSLHVLNTPRCTHDIPPMYSWYPPDVLMISPDVLMISPQCTHDIPQCTHGIPSMYSWYPPDVLNTHYAGCQLPVNLQALRVTSTVVLLHSTNYRTHCSIHRIQFDAWCIAIGLCWLLNIVCSFPFTSCHDCELWDIFLN